MESIKYCSGPRAVENLWQVASGSVTVAYIVCLVLRTIYSRTRTGVFLDFYVIKKWNGDTEASCEKRTDPKLPFLYCPWPGI